MSFAPPRSVTPTASRRTSVSFCSPTARTPLRGDSATTFVPNFTPASERAFGRRLAPASYREPVRDVHSGVVGSNGVPLSRGKGRAHSPSVSHSVVAPTPLGPNERADPLMSMGPAGVWVSKGVRALTPPPLRIQRESGKYHVRSPDSINVFHQTPITIHPSRPCQVPLPSDIPGLTQVPRDRMGAGSGISRGIRVTGPVPFVPPPFEKAPYSPQRRQVPSFSARDSDVLLQRRISVVDTPRRTGLRSVSPSSSTRYNIITNEPW